MSDERLDRLIDEVARQMTDSHPSSDFRARVIANLDRRPGRVWRPIWIVAPLGTLAVAVLVIVVARPFHPSTCSGCPERAEGQGRDRAPERAARQQRSPVAKTETGKADTTYEGPHGPRVAAAGRRQDPSGGAAAEIAALAPPPLEPPSIGIQALGVERLPTESIAITELDAITPIAVEPLPTDDERPASGQRPSPNDRNE